MGLEHILFLERRNRKCQKASHRPLSRPPRGARRKNLLAHAYFSICGPDRATYTATTRGLRFFKRISVTNAARQAVQAYWAVD